MGSELFAPMLALLLSQRVLALEPAPPFTGEDLHSGEPISLVDYRGKVVFIDFWASWCPPCLLSLPAYDAMRKEIGTEQFEIIAVNVDEDTADGLKFLEQQPVDYPVIADPGGRIGTPYGIRTLPRSFLVDRKGRIVATYRSFQPGDEDKIKQDILKLLEGPQAGAHGLE